MLFIVADTNYLRIDLIQIILSVSNSQKHNFLYEFKVCFGEKVHYITIDQNLTSFITPAGKILIALLDKVKLELEIMWRLDMAEPVSEPTEWVNPMIIVEKLNGKLRDFSRSRKS